MFFVYNFFLIFLLVVSCNKEQITITKEPKHTFKGVDEDSQDHSKHKSIFVAIIYQGNEAWFFKLFGQEEEVPKFRKEFKKFIKSLKFNDGKLLWKVESSWKENEVTNSFQQKLFTLGNSCELSISKLPYSDLLSNVNRWYSQIGQPSISNEMLKNKLELIQVGNITAHYIEITH